MKEIGIAEGGTEAEYVVALRMLRYRLHDRPVDDDEVLRRRLDGPRLLRLARVEEQRRTLQADPVALPAALARQLDLVLLAQQPLLHRQESVDSDKRIGYIEYIARVTALAARLFESDKVGNSQGI